MLDLSQLLTSVAGDAMGLRGKSSRRALGFLGGSHRSFFPGSSLIGLAGLAVGAYQILKDKSDTGTGTRTVQPGTQVLDIFSEWKSLYIDYSGKLQKAQIDAVEI